ncbi:MAG TPA: 2-oxo-4-hydroxy-4-carboxy-5-ureidoimidazoline decarboxylase [Candidatus Dormibacteraeota bacterium]|nr:2-oxo-4-hydroxy-4-carboxy-5-ureidoimidazoline decarboxylase [Candidatus Dormibacteraeota bacterium]
MSEGIERFNALPDAEAIQALYACFADRGWAARLAAGRPYQDLPALLESADSAWSHVTPAGWLEAFKAHPRIGEGGGHSPHASRREQSLVSQASRQTLAALAEENRLYEARFGHVFLIAASGRTADDVLEALRRRIGHDPAAELDVAAGEHRKITRLRLERLLIG